MLDLLLRCRYDPTGPLKISIYSVFYYVILEMQVFFNSTSKMKLVSVGIDPDHVGITVDRYGAETIPLSHCGYRFSDYFIMCF